MAHHDHEHHQDDTDFFERPGWEDRYSGDGAVWSGQVNPRVVETAIGLTPGTALDVGCGEGGDVIWLAQQGWRVTGADFSTNGLDRAARHAEQAGVADRCDWWQVDARTFEAGDRSFDLVTTHYLHPPGGTIADVVRRLAGAVAPGGLLLVVGHAPSGTFAGHAQEVHEAMFRAEDLASEVPAGFEVVAAEERPRTLNRDDGPVHAGDSTLLLRRPDGLASGAFS